jgi:hypothetical protein
MNNSMRFAWIAIVALIAAAGSACNQTSNSAAASSNDGKIPITTKSEEARKEFLQGRDLSERLLAQDSLQHFDKAIALDPDFASAELARANSSPTAKEFFEHQKRAVSLGRREASHSGERSGRQRRCRKAEGIPRKAHCRLPE